MSPAQGVLFDLDGTLVDTAPDMATALNRLREREGGTPLPYPVIREQVSNGAGALIRLGFPEADPQAAEFERLRQHFLALYAEALAVESRLFPGMDAVLDTLEARGLRWGVVTNKPAFLTEPLLRALGLSERAGSIVSGDTLPVRKPDPAPLRHASAALSLLPEHCLYVGDHVRDIEAGRAAGMRTIGALFGYIDANDNPQHWGADALIAHPLALLDQLDPPRATP
ncbi:MAG: phosphoglycolate phosphatase [Halothiobacillaceae bacterium]|jgi:phosphoglycolate phosphatase|nr:phosphoglycolate phosphatase [Halothiobacillaceae bacterium]